MYALVAMPLNIPKILYLKHRRAAINGWMTNLLCDTCSDEIKPIISD